MDSLAGAAGWALAAAAVPGVVGFGLSRGAGFGARAARMAAAWSAAAAWLLALGAAGAYLTDGTTTGTLVRVELPGSLRVDLGARVDGLSVIMLFTVTLIGAVVARYSMRYLDGDPRQARFCQWLSYTLSAVLILLVSSNLVLLFLGWIGTSHGLHRLLTHFRERPAALIAARKKFLISRLGDGMLATAFVLIARQFGSLEFSEILPRAAGVPEAELLPIGLLLVLGAMTKSAQFPFHTWLPDSMETPTPVSALMHAGVINGGGFLLIRMSPLLAAAPAALAPLALGGAFTALLGSVAMLVQTDVKRKYAYSTVAQMGFMMLQCGLGAFAAATLHMVGHAFYKAHAFLSAGTAVDRAAPAPGPRSAPRPAGGLALALAIAGGFALVSLVALATGVDPQAKPGWSVLGCVLALAAAQILLTAPSGEGPRLRALGAAAGIAGGIAAVYFVGVAAVARLLGDVVPSVPAVTSSGLALVLIGLFVVAVGVQHRLAAGSASRFARAAYVHLSNGFYLGAIQNRWVEALWPLSERDRTHTRGARA